jgi:hypothetical protein
LISSYLFLTIWGILVYQTPAPDVFPGPGNVRWVRREIHPEKIGVGSVSRKVTITLATRLNDK